MKDSKQRERSWALLSMATQQGQQEQQLGRRNN